MYGCGFHGYEGHSEVEYTNGATEAPYNRTCPRFCYLSSEYQELFTVIKLFRKNQLGNILDLEAPMFECLQMLDAEMEIWEAETKKQLTRRGAK